ncbi:hypothetical protein [Mesotoga prima]|nr:hypothetical protein [Mesotoga prima]HNQ71284.1 hypothetical protein [Mesotoga prima]HNS76309.1 hypothetical protein [Mesotoga prima]HQC15671.1 hypothetical protein [Mesotoga prima]
MRLGLGEEGDEINFLFRTAFFENDEDRESYVSDPPIFIPS